MNFENLKAKFKTVNKKYVLCGAVSGITAFILTYAISINANGKVVNTLDTAYSDDLVVITDTTTSTSTTTTVVTSTTTTTTVKETTTTVATTTTQTETTTTEESLYVPEYTSEEETFTVTVSDETSYTEVSSDEYYIDEYSRRLLAEITCHEYGSDWVPTGEKAKIVAAVMNRVNSPDYPDTVYDVLMQDGQFHGSWDGGHGYWPGCVEPNEDSWAAVDFYFNNPDQFSNFYCTSWSGDGRWNYFY